MSQRPKIWVIWFDRIGDRNQAEGLARLTGVPYEMKRLLSDGTTLLEEYRQLAPSLRPSLLIVVDRVATAAGLKLKRWSQGTLKLVKIGRPVRGWPFSVKPDLTITPRQYSTIAYRSAILIDLPFCLVTDASLSAASREFNPLLAHLPRPRIAVLVGGRTNQLGWSNAIAAELGAKINRLAEDSGGSLMIATSYRTGDEPTNKLMEQITVPHVAHLWDGNEDRNPLMGYLAFADRSIVTMDSLSMIADAIAAGKPVQVFPLPFKRGDFVSWVSSKLPFSTNRNVLIDRLVSDEKLSWFKSPSGILFAPKQPSDTIEAVEAVRALLAEKMLGDVEYNAKT